MRWIIYMNEAGEKNIFCASDINFRKIVEQVAEGRILSDALAALSKAHPDDAEEMSFSFDATAAQARLAGYKAEDAKKAAERDAKAAAKTADAMQKKAAELLAKAAELQAKAAPAPAETTVEETTVEATAETPVEATAEETPAEDREAALKAAAVRVRRRKAGNE